MHLAPQCVISTIFKISPPLQGRLNELMSQLRMQTQVPGARADQLCALDPILLDEIRQVPRIPLPSSLGLIVIHIMQTLCGRWAG